MHSKSFSSKRPKPTEGELQSPGYRTSRAFRFALLPPKRSPVARNNAAIPCWRVKYKDVRSLLRQAFRPDLTTIVVIGDITPEEARPVIEKYFGEWKATGPKPEVVLPPFPVNKPSAVTVPDPAKYRIRSSLSRNWR